MNWFLKALQKYAVFHGRARRSEYWYFILFYLLFYYLSILLGSMIDKQQGSQLAALSFSALLFIPSLAVSVRRLHDTSKSGWWLCIILVPLVGPFIFLYFAVQEGVDRHNRHGPNPKWEA